MPGSELHEYKFKSIYTFVEIISKEVNDGFDFWNFDADQFVQSALKFNKTSLLHLYVSRTLCCYYRRIFRKDGDLYELEDIVWWINLMKEYGVRLTKRGYREEDPFCIWNWFQKNETIFERFFHVIAGEVVHILYNDKQFLLNFNRLIRNVLIDKSGFYSSFLNWPEGSRNKNGTIKRCAIPKWVKYAVYHRDKGHCVFCNKDLTRSISIFDSQENYDHIVPLKDYGTNDPCNLQLTCEECNKKKGGKDIAPIYMYQSWW